MAQIARPIADVDMSTWSCSTGGNRYALIDEAVANEDTDYVFIAAGGGGAPIPTPKGVLLGPVTDPVVHTGHTITIRIRHTDDVDVTWNVTLFCGNDTVATPSWASVNSQAYVDLTYTLSAGEAALITDYSQLKLYPNMTPQACDIRVTQAYMSFPDVGSTHQRTTRGFGK